MPNPASSVSSELSKQGCDYCGQENGLDSARCVGCGTPLRKSEGLNPLQEMEGESPRRAAGQALVRQGIVFVVVGSLVTLFRSSAVFSSSFTGADLFVYGAILSGVAQIVRGCWAARGTDDRIAAEELLTEAAGWENSDPARAVELYKEVIRRFPGTPASEEAQRNIETLWAGKRGKSPASERTGSTPCVPENPSGNA